MDSNGFDENGLVRLWAAAPEGVGELMAEGDAPGVDGWPASTQHRYDPTTRWSLQVQSETRCFRVAPPPKYPGEIPPYGQWYRMAG
jgi:hypothetical protein